VLSRASPDPITFGYGNARLGSEPPAFDNATRTRVRISPSAPPHSRLRPGLQAFALTSGCRLALRSRSLFDGPYLGSAPTIAGGLALLGSGHDGRLRVYRLGDGLGRWSGDLFRKPIYATPSVDRGVVFTAGRGGRVTAFGVGP
jgi:hypothetical protein